VFIFHLHHKWLPGGFVGVDVFFVISGYLITSIIFGDCQQNTFSLRKFYQRRIARILPAFLSVALATLLGAWLIYGSQDFASCGANLAAATLSIANMKFMLQGNYFTISPDAQPFLHYWTLSVEEQFYMFFPLIFLLLYKIARNRTTLVLIIMWVASFLACVLLTQMKPIWAFFLLPTRAWELLSGSILAVSTGQQRPMSRHASMFHKSLPVIGLLLIGASFLFVTEGDHFPGYQALFPVLGAVCILVPVKGIDKNRVDDFLSLAPLVVIGRMSYSLYLWHYPIFSLTDYAMYLASEPVRLACKIGLSVAATVASYKLIESPLRVFLNQGRNRVAAYAFLGCSVLLCVPLGTAVRKANHINSELGDVARGGVVFNAGCKNGVLVLMGDSNGSMYGMMARELASALGFRLNVISVDAGDPLPSNGHNGKLWLDSLAVVHHEKPDFVLLACSWAGKLEKDRGRLEIAINELKKDAGCIILITQPPILPENANRQSIREGARPPFLEAPNIRLSRLEANDFVKSLQSGFSPLKRVRFSFWINSDANFTKTQDTSPGLAQIWSKQAL
jgi:peptidoglycan/LPS O-acetylase OafA/YrhL